LVDPVEQGRLILTFLRKDEKRSRKTILNILRKEQKEEQKGHSCLRIGLFSSRRFDRK